MIFFCGPGEGGRQPRPPCASPGVTQLPLEVCTQSPPLPISVTRVLLGTWPFPSTYVLSRAAFKVLGQGCVVAPETGGLANLERLLSGSLQKTCIRPYSCL